ncbi:methyltransferase domain-containing protein [Swingsia samuiensis]|uniref:Methyltransferase domain-containing protein n=1 Tax=Swingsia samuiensis TaxID=1293412 RepID=A0A4Y6UL36_9PROT|nr:methyltransferase domain-containing protein [Swingsia samuiensis]QDH17111.1 methyltransferase domain-containing protein [Swingsia samuiensis]
MTQTSRKKLISARFNNAAHHYDAAASIQRQTADVLMKHIREQYSSYHPTSILEFGCGTGYMTQNIASSFPHTPLLATDIAPNMVAQSQAKLSSYKNVSFDLMDAENPSPTGMFDLITSNLCFQWIENRTKALEELSHKLASGGYLIFTTLLRNTLHEWQESCVHENVPCGVPLYPTVTTIQSEWPLNGQGAWLEIPLYDPVPNSLSFLRNLHSIGASLPHSGSAPTSAATLRRAMRYFDQHYTKVTYHIGLGIFRKHSHD